MSGIAIYARLRAKPGAEAALESWMAELIERVRAGDPGTVAFCFHRDAVTGDYVCMEHYRDAAAVEGHFANVADLLARLPAISDPGDRPVEVCGDLSPALRDHYLPWNPRFMSPVAAL